MRPIVIAGNWKMHKDLRASEELIRAVRAEESSFADSPVQVILCPPFTSLSRAADLLRGSRIHLGAQNMSEHNEGAFTGEISWNMLRSAGCSYVIVGHSERRQLFGETDGLINRKAKKALANGLTPIVCVGETLEQREGGETVEVVSTQVRGVLEGLSGHDAGRTILAYEPVWAIGTGRNATPDQAQEVHSHIRMLLENMFDARTSQRIVIQYGGSVKPDNARALLSQPDIDGALVGGACLDSSSFWGIIRSTPP